MAHRLDGTDPYGRTLHFLKKQGDAYEATSHLRFPEFIARNAGSLFRFEGQLYRPAQICNRHYGEGVLLQPLNYDPHTGWSVGGGMRLHATDPRFSQGFIRSTRMKMPLLSTVCRIDTRIYAD